MFAHFGFSPVTSTQIEESRCDLERERGKERERENAEQLSELEVSSISIQLKCSMFLILLDNIFSACSG